MAQSSPRQKGGKLVYQLSKTPLVEILSVFQNVENE
jgi:hypothetical protein